MAELLVLFPKLRYPLSQLVVSGVSLREFLGVGLVVVGIPLESSLTNPDLARPVDTDRAVIVNTLLLVPADFDYFNLSGFFQSG